MRHADNTSRSRWQFSVRELVLLMAVVALAIGYWQAVRKTNFTRSPFYNRQLGRLLRPIPSSSKNPLMNGGSSESGSPGYSLRTSHYTLRARNETMDLSDFVPRLAKEVRLLLEVDDCDVDRVGERRAGKQLTGFSYGYRWESTTGLIEVTSFATEPDELRLSVTQLEFAPDVP